MIFTAAQIQDIVSILQRHQLTFIAEQLGLNYLSPNDRAILTAAGIDLTKFTNNQGIIDHAYLFGLLAEAIGDKRAKDMNYQQFQKFIKSGQFVPLTDEEEFVLEQVKNQSYNDISGLGSRIIQGTKNIVIRANLREQNKIRKIIQKKAEDAVKYRQSAAKMASELGHATKDWERDWLRISYTVLQNAYNYGRARAIFRDHGEDAEVYFDVLKGACKHCKRLYLTDPEDENSQPIIFKLKDIIANGNNIGRKVADYLPTISPVHPYCFNSPAVKIYTSRGWKKIKDIKVGDLVLTHKGRFKRVTQLHIRQCDDNERIYEIEYKTGNKNNGIVHRITGNHPVLTVKGWKRVDELTISDKLFTPTFVCQECGDNWGLDTFRFSEDDIVNHGDEVFKELQRLFNNHRGNYGIKVTEIVSIKRVKTGVRSVNRKLYNFSVDDDESYIADGIVVHNCRCTVRHKDPNMEWDSTTLSFTKPKKFVPKNKKLQGIKLNIKVKKAEEDEINRDSFQQRLSEAKKQTEQKPTENQIKAGNYKKGHISFGGYTYVIENPKGSTRSGVDNSGKKWSITMNNTYGYFLGTLGKDKDHIDVFINDDADLDKFNGRIFIVDQVNKDGSFDEHKIMYGFKNRMLAARAYKSNYEKGWTGLGSITGVSKEEFDKWIKGSKRKIKPFRDYVRKQS